MIDGIIKENGNSRYLRSVANLLALYPTYESFAAALVAGTLPIDLAGINEEGWETIGTALNKANLLSDETAGALDVANVDEALSALAPANIGSIITKGYLGFEDEDGRYLYCDGSVVSAYDYPLLKKVFPTGTTWTSRTSGVTTDLYDVSYGNGMFVVCGYSGVMIVSDPAEVTLLISPNADTVGYFDYIKALEVAD